MAGQACIAYRLAPMRTLRTSCLVAFAVAALLVVIAPAASAQRTVFKGQFQCDDRGEITPLDGMAVELWKRGEEWLPVETEASRVASRFTGSDGTFSMRTPPDPDNYFVRMALRDAHGVHLRDFWGINDWSIELAHVPNDRATRDFGGIVFSTPGQSHKCAIWAGVHRANEAFRAETGTELPTRGVEIQADAVTAGTPFTPGTSILWPGGYAVGHEAGQEETTRHEYAHAMRHGLDGDFGHFVGDAATFNYAQNHEACGRTNAGFAFNEGWAEFWAEDFWPAPDCGRPDDMDTEGNVAAALTELMENCAGGQRRLMVENLRRNPQRIHSFVEFRDLLGCPVPRPVPVLVVAATARLAPPPSPPTIRADAASEEARAGSSLIRRLRKSLKVALRKAESPPACVKEPCKAALKTLTRPGGLKIELALAKIQKGAADDFDSADEQTKLAGLSTVQLLDLDAGQEARNRKKAVHAALVGLREALRSAAPVFKEDSSRFTKGFRRDLKRSLAGFRRAEKHGATVLPTSLILSPPAAQPPRRVPVIPPTPRPSLPGPTIQTLVPTTLTFEECPAIVAAPKPIEVDGRLLPAQAGSAVTVTFSHKSAGSVTVVAPTDAAGNWAASHTPAPNATGTWTVDATYPGDSTRLPSSAASCSVAYE
jgi:hypothetical protein